MCSARPCFIDGSKDMSSGRYGSHEQTEVIIAVRVESHPELRGMEERQSDEAGSATNR